MNGLSEMIEVEINFLNKCRITEDRMPSIDEFSTWDFDLLKIMVYSNTLKFIEHKKIYLHWVIKESRMDVCVNEHTGNYFIFIQYIGDKMLLITPTGEMKSLEDRFFSEPTDKDENALLLANLITDSQIESYQTYKKNRDEEQMEWFMSLFEELTSWQKKDLLEKISNER